MPTYDFKNIITNDITEKVMKMSELTEFKLNNPLLELVISGGVVCSAIRMEGGLNKGGNFKEVLNRIHERTPGSCLDKTSNL